MAKEVRLPQFGMTMESARVVRWLRDEKDFVEKDTPLLELENDKAVIEFVAPFAGYLKIIAGENEVLPVGALLAILLDSSDEVYSPSVVSQSCKGGKKRDGELTEAPAISSGTSDISIKATPVARSLAKGYAIDLALVAGSGEGGRIEKQDVLKYLETKSMNTGPRIKQSIDVRGARAAIARHVLESKNVPQVALFKTLNLTSIWTHREETRAADREKYAIDSYFIYYCAKALEGFPMLNAAFQENKIIVYDNINVGFAVGRKEGIVFPVIEDANRLSLDEINTKLRKFSEAARANRLGAGIGTFSISNLGGFGIDTFIPLINVPQAAILGIGTIKEQEKRMVCTCSLVIDHRIIDGDYAAQFLVSLDGLFEKGKLR